MFALELYLFLHTIDIDSVNTDPQNLRFGSSATANNKICKQSTIRSNMNLDDDILSKIDLQMELLVDFKRITILIAHNQANTTSLKKVYLDPYELSGLTVFLKRSKHRQFLSLKKGMCLLFI